MTNKDCPFCGGEVDAKGWRSDTEQGPECEDCGATARTLKRWNTRIPTADDRALFIAITELESVPEPPVRQCNHGAISPKGTLFYHGFVGPANHWRCDVCKGVYEGNLTDPSGVALTLVSPSNALSPWMRFVTYAEQITAPCCHDEGDNHWRVRSRSGGVYRSLQLTDALKDFWECEIRARDLDGNPTEPEPASAPEPFVHPYGDHPHQVCGCGAKVPTDVHLLHTCGDRLTPVPSKDLCSQLRGLTAGARLLGYTAAEHIERLETALRGIQSCSTCEACRGAATLALGGATPEPAAGRNFTPEEARAYKAFVEDYFGAAQPPGTAPCPACAEACEMLGRAGIADGDLIDKVGDAIEAMESASQPPRAMHANSGAWMIVYDDQDRKPEAFSGHGAEDAAYRRFDQISGQWNAHLFARVGSNSRDALTKEPSRDLLTYGYAPGNYMSNCLTCGQNMQDVDKRCRTCKACAEKKMRAALGEHGEHVT